MRYLGHKPVNWAASALIFGGMVGSAAYILWGAGAVSIFRAMLPSSPLMWWPRMSFIGFFLTMSPLALGALALWLVPVSDWSVKVSVGLVASGVVLFICGIAWDSGSGVALYSDRVVYRVAGFREPLRIGRFADIRRVETSCVVRRGRNRGGAEPSYILQFGDGERIDIWSGSYSSQRGNASARFAFVRAANAAAMRAGAIRAPRRKPDGTLIGDPGCVSLLAKRLKVPEQVVGSLFSLHQSELFPGEYDMAPKGAGT